jgi:DNA-binding SARP family transcriptional activator/WD40 repeat protein/energy-coupling factor transporter ATP-binding protein EcfA2
VVVLIAIVEEGLRSAELGRAALAPGHPRAYARPMRFLVLGPVEVLGEEGQRIVLAGAKERTVLAALVARSGAIVSADELIEELWGDDPPRTARRTLGIYVSRLRKSLERGNRAESPDVIRAAGGGYAFDQDRRGIDAVRFDALAEQGRELLDQGDSERASVVLDEALALWRGSAYQDVDAPFARVEAERLHELRRSVGEMRIDAILARGSTPRLVAELEAMVRDEPLRERRWAQLMLALYRDGRQAEALDAYRRAGSILADELGVDPGPELRRLQSSILMQAPGLDVVHPPSAPEPARATDVCPYKGLARFDTADAEFFFGREETVAEAVGRLVSGSFLALVGASGSGKSSLLRAGVIHALKSGAIPGSDRWTYRVFRPGEHPAASLRGAIERPPTGASSVGVAEALRSAGMHASGRLVLGVDQFEEVFTEANDPAERMAFLDALTRAALERDGPVTVVVAMRADFYGRCAEHRALATLVASHQILVAPMNAKEIRRAIERPAERVGLEIDEDLADALVSNTVDRVGGLPLLSTALLELWSKRRGSVLRLDDLLRTGGVEGAVARLAEDAYARLDPDQQAAAKRILLRLARSGESLEPVRRTATLDEFDLGRDADTAAAMRVLTEARLVTVAEGTAEVAHEALLRDWPRLRAWLDEDAEGRKLHAHLTASAASWREGGRDEADLYRGVRLTSALDWAGTRGGDLNTLEREYLDRGRSAAEGEALRTRRTNRRLRASLGVVAALLVISLGIGGLALGQRDAARASADTADARQLALGSLAEKDTIVSLLLARQAVALDDTPQTRGALLSALQREPAGIATMHANVPPGDLTEWVELSPDGRTMVEGGAGHSLQVFDARTHTRTGTIEVGSATTAGAFDPRDGKLDVIAADRRIVRIDLDRGEVVASTPSRGDIDAILVTRDGAHVITAESTGGSGYLVPRDPATLRPTATPIRSSNDPITSMVSSDDGRELIVTSLPPDPESGYGGSTTVWRLPGLERVGGPFRIGGNDVALSPDGRTVAIAAAENGARYQNDSLKGHLVILDLRTGRWTTSAEGRLATEGGGLGLTGLVFSVDGRSVISTGDDHRAVIWDAASATVERSFDDASGLVLFSPALSPDGATLYAVDVNGSIPAWDLGGGRSIARPFTAGSGATSHGFSAPWFAMSPDGRTLAIIQAASFLGPGSVRLVDTSTLEGVGVIPYTGSRYPQEAVFGPDGSTVAVTSFDGYIDLRDVVSGRPEGVRFQLPPAVSPNVDFWTAAFSPDGSLLATGGFADWNHADAGGVVFLWNPKTGRLLDRLPDSQAIPNHLNFTPDGKRLLVSMGINGKGVVEIWNVDERRIEGTIRADDTGLFWADVSDDGTTVVTGGESNTEQLWDLSTRMPVGTALKGPSPNNTVDLSTDGRTLVAAGTGRVSMWDAPTATVLGTSFVDPGSDDGLAALFTPDGRRLFIVSETGEAWVWDVDPSSWEARACRIAGRSLTPAEWQAHLPDRPYQPTCGS